LNDAQQRNFQKWNILGNYVWPNFYVGTTYQDELNFFNTWISSRLIWMDNNIPGNCNIINNTGLEDISTSIKTLIKITDLLGRETKENNNVPLLYIYNDGTVEKKIVIQ